MDKRVYDYMPDGFVEEALTKKQMIGIGAGALAVGGAILGRNKIKKFFKAIGRGIVRYLEFLGELEEAKRQELIDWFPTALEPYDEIMTGLQYVNTGSFTNRGSQAMDEIQARIAKIKIAHGRIKSNDWQAIQAFSVESAQNLTAINSLIDVMSNTAVDVNFTQQAMDAAQQAHAMGVNAHAQATFGHPIM